MWVHGWRILWPFPLRWSIWYCILKQKHRLTISFNRKSSERTTKPLSIVYIYLEQLEQLEQLEPKQEPYYQVPSFEKHLVGRMVELLEPLSVEEFYNVVVTFLDYLVALMAHSLWSFQVLEQI